MRILMASILDFSAEVNGVVVSTRELAASLNATGHKVRILTPYKMSRTHILYRGMVYTAGLFKRTRISLFSLLNLLAKFIVLFRMTSKASRDVEVFHAHDIVSAGVFLLFKRSGNQVLLQTHFHSMPWNEFYAAGYFREKSFSARLLKRYSWYVLSHPGLQIVHVSKHNRDLISRSVPHRKGSGVILYPGLNAIKTNVDLSLKRPYLVNVGRIDSRKNQILLVDILAELKRTGLELPLYLVGPEDEAVKENLLQRAHMKGVGDQIFFWGQQSRVKTSRLIANARLYIHTSFSESFGRTLIEAIQLKTPVLALEYPAVKEIIDAPGILRRTDSPREMADIVSRLLLADEKRAGLQQSQYRRFQTRFTQEAMLASYNNLIQSRQIHF